MSALPPIPLRKFFGVTTLICVAFFVIGVRLIHLQIKLRDIFLDKSTKNFLHVEPVFSPRGNILDCKGCLLATNRPMHNVYWAGSGNYKLTDKQKNKLNVIGNIIKAPLEQKTVEKIQNAERHYKRALIACDIQFEQLSQIEEAFPFGHNITIKTSFKRFYPHTSYASHILGYLGRMDIDFTGKMGLEYLFENKLKGKQGAIMATINSFGRKLSETPLEKAFSGGDIKTTLDLNIQSIVEKIFPANQTGTCLLMNSDNGAIVAMTSRPNFDPSLFLAPISHTSWQNLQNEHPFLNRAFDAQYPPGSIFKLIVTCAALEHDIITPETIWNCKGHITFAGRRYHCNVREGHGELTVSQALEQSCNPFFYEIGTKLSIDALADYAKRFGLGQKTNIIFPEKNGLIPTIAWKEETMGERWWPGETLSASIGQSFLLVTPIQVARMIAAIFSGNLVTPRILSDEPILKVPVDIKPETLEFLKQSMKKVVTQGTGKQINRIKDIEIYAKTSTAQTSALSKRNQGRIYKEHGWFVAQFRYKKEKPLTMVVLVEHAGSSRIPTIIAKKFLIRYKKLVDETSDRGQRG